MRFFLLLIFVLIPLKSFAQTEEELQTLEERGYGFYVPSAYDEDEAVPLLIALHGFGDEWRNFSSATGLIDLAEEETFIVAFPNGYLRQWNDGSVGDHYEDDVRFLEVLIERIARDYTVDRERVYLLGFSNGGTMVYRAACEAPDLFAGIVAIGGTMRRAQRCPDEVQLPIIIIHGTADSTVPFDGGNGRYSVPETALFWARQNDCDLEAVPDYDPEAFERSIASYHWQDCAEDSQVLLYVVEGMPHTYPGAREYVRGIEPDSRVDSARLIWDFFTSPSD